VKTGLIGVGAVGDDEASLPRIPTSDSDKWRLPVPGNCSTVRFGEFKAAA
jgi:hypothetical protein